MSPNVGNFVHDLVEMAKAMETLPTVQAELTESRKLHAETLDAAQKLQLRIMDYKNDIDALHATIRRLEVERDDAELRFLELEDKSHNAIAMAKAAAVSLGQLTGLLDPPKADPIPTPPAEAEVVHQEPMFEPHTYDKPVPVTIYPKDAEPISGQVASDGSFVPSLEVPTSPANPPNEPTTYNEQSKSPSDLGSEGVGDPLPTSAPPAPIGTGMEQGQSGSDEDIEPMKRDEDGTVRQAWWDWHDRKYGEVKF